jgi:hypothetical protein
MSQEKLHVRLKSQGRENMTGLFGKYQFVDGVSAEPIPFREAMRMGASCFVEDLNGKQISPGTYTFSDCSNVPAPVATLPLATPHVEIAKTNEAQTPVAQSIEATNTVDKFASVDNLGEDVQSAPKLVFTKEQLEAIADKQGITGLREIADPLEVKSQSISGLIKGILDAQGV